MPAPAATPAAGGFAEHVREFFERDVRPELDDLKADAAKWRIIAPEIGKLADLAVTLAEADPGIPPGVLAAAEKAAAVIAGVTADLAEGTGM